MWFEALTRLLKPLKMFARRSEVLLLQLLIFLNVHLSGSVLWDHIFCAPDGDQTVPEGRIPGIWRFPWLGLVQHSFNIGGQVKYAVTPAVLVHPAFAIASAADMAKIPPEQLVNNTVLILWKNSEEKYAIDIIDYILHPEFQSGVTMASIALLQLVSYEDMGATVGEKVGEMEKAMHKMNFVEDKDCAEFYFRAELTYEKMSPKSAICAVMEAAGAYCVWDAGTALVTRQNWGYWTLKQANLAGSILKLGFGVRGPGCGAPAKFLVFHDYLPWITSVIDNVPLEEDNDMYKLALRHKSPIEIIMFKATAKLPMDQGQCDRRQRGVVVYKENHEMLCDKNFAQGFFFSTITDLAMFTCVIVRLEVSSRTNAAIWLEYSCHRDMTGSHSYNQRHNMRMQECFLYFKTSAFLEFRFYFSFKAAIDVTLYGQPETSRFVPNPNPISEATYPWWPTESIIEWENFNPFGYNPWNL